MQTTMKQRNSYPTGWAVVACGFLLMSGVVKSGMAQQAATKSTPRPGASTSLPFSALQPGAAPSPVAAKSLDANGEEAAKPGQAGGEGIRVHGHWVIDVKNLDGTVARHLDFQNSLVPHGAALSGDQLLAGLLSGNVSPGDPAIAFISSVSESGVTASDPSTYCGNFTATISSGICSFLTTPQSVLGILTYPNLQTGLHAVVNFSPSVNWVLSGNWTVPSGTTSILYVQTIVPSCISQAFSTATESVTSQGYVLSGSSFDRSADVSSNSCLSTALKVLSSSGTDYALLFPFTSTLIPGQPAAGMAVTPGQVITVTVTISFS